MAQPFNSISIDRIAELNKAILAHSGGLQSSGPNNFHNRQSLEYILEAVLFPVFGIDRYPTAIDKMAAIAHTIITTHVFNDGNKRTGLAVIAALSEFNGFYFRINKEAEDFMVRIAADSLSVDNIATWLKTRLIPKK